jgi:hypothetical protein
MLSTRTDSDLSSSRTEKQVSEAYTPVHPSTGRLSTPGPITFAIALKPSSIPDSLLSMSGSWDSFFLNPSCSQHIGKCPFAVSWWLVSWRPTSQANYQKVLIDIAHHKYDESEALELLMGWARACAQHLCAIVPFTTILPVPLVLVTASGSLAIFHIQDRAITPWRRFDNVHGLKGGIRNLLCFVAWVNGWKRFIGHGWRSTFGSLRGVWMTVLPPLLLSTGNVFVCKIAIWVGQRV